MKRFVFALLLGACQQGGLPNTPTEPQVTAAPAATVFTPGLTVVANDPRALDAGKTPARFHLSTVRELYLRLGLPSYPGGIVWAKVTLFNPLGAPHIQRWVPFTNDPSVAEVSGRDGVTGQVPTYPVSKLSEGVGLDYALVVGGSNLVKRPMPGLWRLRFEVEGSPGLTAERTLELTTAPPSDD